MIYMQQEPVGRTRGMIWWPSSLSWLELQTCSSPPGRQRRWRRWRWRWRRWRRRRRRLGLLPSSLSGPASARPVSFPVTAGRTRAPAGSRTRARTRARPACRGAGRGAAVAGGGRRAAGLELLTAATRAPRGSWHPTARPPWGSPDPLERRRPGPPGEAMTTPSLDPASCCFLCTVMGSK